MRQRLALQSLAVSALLVAAFVIPLAAMVRSGAEDRALDRAQADVNSLIPVVATSSNPAVLAAAVSTTVAGQDRRLSIANTDGLIAGEPLPSDSAVAAALAEARSVVEPQDRGIEVVRVVHAVSGDVVAIRVLVPDDERREGVALAWTALAISGLVLIGIGMLSADRLARGVVRSVQAMSQAARRLGAGDLSARVEPTGPGELKELAGTFNLLGSQVEGMIDRERSMVADMSHQLRTPLTRLRLRIDQVREPELADALRSDLDATTEALTTIIDATRRSIDDRERAQAQCDAAAVVQDRVDFWAVLADDEQRQVEVDIAANKIIVSIGEAELSEIVDILIDNVFSHTPTATPFAVRIRRRADRAMLEVSDEAGQASTGHGGSGIGHRIIEDRMNEIGGSLTTDSDPTGYTARVFLPTID